MESRRNVFFKLLLGAFGLMLVAFSVRGIGSLLVGSEQSTMIAGPIFLLALACAVAGFVLALGLKVQELRTTDTDG